VAAQRWSLADRTGNQFALKLHYSVENSRIGFHESWMLWEGALVYQLSREQGLSQKQVAEEPDISEKMVKKHMSRAYKTPKTGLRIFFIAL